MSETSIQENVLKKESTTARTMLSSSWTLRSTQSKTLTPRSLSPISTSKEESIYHKYIDLIISKSNISINEKDAEPPERPFDFSDDEEYAFGLNLLNNNVACVGENISRLVQMGKVLSNILDH